MAETTTTTTTQKPADEDKEQVRKGAAPEQTAAGNSSDNTTGPSREESLKAAGEASPHAPDAGLKDGTKVLGSEGQSSQDRMDEARREAVANAEGEQDVHA